MDAGGRKLKWVGKLGGQGGWEDLQEITQGE